MESIVIPALKNRLPLDELDGSKQIFSDNNIFTQILDSSPTCILVLNKYRQIVYMNDAVKQMVHIQNVDETYGKRPGELFNCQCAFLTKYGCGTTEFCETCGALKVIISALNGEQEIQECRIIQNETNDALDLRVWAKRLVVNDEVFSVFSFVDISHEKRRFALERIFFHDILNSAGSLISCVNLIKNSSKEEVEEILPITSELTNKLVDEIKAQRDLSMAENSELTVNMETCNSLNMITNITKFYYQRFIMDEKILEIAHGCESINFVSDGLLVSRVLGNMIKNAIESSTRGSLTTIGCKLVNNRVRFFVNNPGFIPRPIQNQIFQRSFTTKGIGRGLGTYSMKLLTERYLKGTVSFISSNEEGTTFYAEYPVNLSEA